MKNSLTSSLSKKKSIKGMLKVSYKVIIAIMAIPTLILLAAIWGMSSQYSRSVANINTATEIQRVVQNQLTVEMWDIIAGKQNFSEGRQQDLIEQIDSGLNALTSNNKEAMQYIIAAGRANDTVKSYVDQIGQQIAERSSVAYNEGVYREIVSVADLMYNMLEQYIREEISSIAVQSENIRMAVIAISILAGALFGTVMSFAILTYSDVQRAIHAPILNMEEMTARIAAGDLEARAESLEIEEVESLTKSLNVMAGRLQALIDERVSVQQDLQKSEIRALQAQITPHFVYNTFETIVWLAEKQRTKEVVNITMAFTDFFRISLSQGKDFITVQREEQHVRSYLEIQSVRYEDIMSYEIAIEDSLKDFLMLKLLLQPLVENAIYHGLKKKRSRGKIWITGTKREDDTMRFQVEDNGLGMTEERLSQVRKRLQQKQELEEGGFGIFNVNQRICLYYGGTGLEISSEYGKGTRVSFTLPCRDILHD
ncbi:MAG: sensor histidine kinase [Lachnospiraceae bacterium]